MIETGIAWLVHVHRLFDYRRVRAAINIARFFGRLLDQFGRKGEVTVLLRLNRHTAQHAQPHRLVRYWIVFDASEKTRSASVN